MYNAPCAHVRGGASIYIRGLCVALLQAKYVCM